MSGVRSSLAACFVSGFIIVLPLFLLILVFAQLIELAVARIYPLLEALPGQVFQNPVIRLCAVILVILLGFLLVGGACPHVCRKNGRSLAGAETAESHAVL